METITLAVHFIIFIGLCKAAAVDSEKNFEWDPCTTDVTTQFGSDFDESNKKYELFTFAPPSCKLFTRRDNYNCDCQGCLTNATDSIRFFSCRPYQYYSECEDYPQLPAAVTILDLSIGYEKSITTRNFANIYHLASVKSLLLIKTNIVFISDDVLRNLSSLECVNLDRNTNLGTEGKTVLHKLLAVPTLRRLSARYCNLTVDILTSFYNITRSNVVSMWFSHNNIGDIEGQSVQKAFRSFVKLSYLDLSDNEIKNIETGFHSSTLQTLDLSSNFLTRVPLLCEKGRSKRAKSGCFKLTKLNLANNRISVVYKQSSDSRTYPECLPNLQILDLSGNRFHTVKIDQFAKHFKVLNVLNVQFQNPYNAPNSLSVTCSRLFSPDAKSVLELHLENNNELRFDIIITNLTEKPFLKCLPHLQRLFLNGSNLHLIDEDAFVDIFGHLKYLQTFSLPNCKLEFVSAAAFAHFPNLRILILRDNFLTTIPAGGFDSLTQLTHLDLSGNKIVSLSQLTFSSALRGRLEFLDLSQNPLACSCDLMWFRDWFTSQPELFSSSATVYKCYNFLRKINMSDYAVNAQACLFSQEVNSMIIFICSVIVITLTSFILLFRYRWHFRLILYEAFRGRGDVRRQYLERGNFDHDVFVSYASEDLDWVRRHLMPQLEDRLQLRLCIHDTQFIPGKNIVDNIVDCVEKSKKILMVFTKNFVSSQWCQFELAYCLSHVMEHEDALIVVCVDDVVSHDMTSAMMAVLKTTTYIQWEVQADAVRSFWGRLDIALEEVIHNEEHAV